MFGLTVPRLRLDYWPEATVVSGTDIVVAGISLRRLAEVCGTPTSHSAAAVVPNSGQRPSSAAYTGVLVTRVLHVAEHYSGAPVVEVDARLDNLRLVWSEARLIGARTGSRSRLSLLVRRAGTADIRATDDVLAVELPSRAAVGDVIAIPSRAIASAPRRQLHPVTGLTQWQPNSAFEESGSTPPNWWEAID